MQDFFALRQNMIDNQIRTSDVTDGALIKAFLSIPREIFVPETERPFAYSDRDIPISAAAERNRWMMGPVPLAKILDALKLREDASVLVVGCGTGFSAAILAQIARAVVAIEEDPALTDTAERNLAELQISNVTVLRRRIVEGAREHGPYDGILVDGAAQVIPDELVAQLAPGAVLGAIEVSDRISRAVLCERVRGETTKWPLFEAWTTGILPGFERTPQFVF